MACTNDFTPLIVAISAIISVQVPLVIAFILNSIKIRHDVSVAKGLAYDNRTAVSELTLITKNGFHGPPGPQGPPGPAAPAAPPAGQVPPPPPIAAA